MRDDGPNSADLPIQRDNLGAELRGLSNWMIGAESWLIAASAARRLTSSP